MVCLDVAQLYPTIEAVLGRTRLKALIIGSVAEALPPVTALLYRLFKRRERIAFAPDARHIPFAQLLDNDGRFDAPAIDPHQDIALLQYTGGTTGTPKGATLTHANLSINAQQIAVIDAHSGRGDRILGALPLFHVFANTCVLNRSILLGDEMVLLPKFEPLAALKAIQRRKVTAVPGVPTMYQLLIDHPQIGRFDLSSVRICISGGAPMPAELKQRFEGVTGATLVEGYGLTESAGVVATSPPRRRPCSTASTSTPATSAISTRTASSSSSIV
jgi:long-chain acyl-CoA synthetase